MDLMRFRENRLQLLLFRQWVSAVNHAMAVRAQQGYIFQLCCFLGFEFRDRNRMMALDKTIPKFSICYFEIELTDLASKIPTFLQCEILGLFNY